MKMYDSIVIAERLCFQSTHVTNQTKQDVSKCVIRKEMKANVIVMRDTSLMERNVKRVSTLLPYVTVTE